MASLITNTRLQSAVQTILRLNVKEESQSGMISLTKKQTQYTFSQNLTQTTLHELTQFIRKYEPNTAAVQDSYIYAYINAESKNQLEKQKERQMFRHRFGPLYSRIAFVFCIYLWLIREANLLLLIGSVLLFWFNRIYYFNIREKLRSDNLTLSDCEYVLSSLSYKKVQKVILYFVCVLMVIIAVFLPKLASENRQTNLQQQYDNTGDANESNLEEIDYLLEEEEYQKTL